MKKFNPNKNIIITLLVVILVVIVVSLSSAFRTNNGSTTFGQSVINDGTSFVDRLLSFPGEFIGNTARTVSNLVDTYHENERLKEKIDSYGEIALQNDNYKKENEALRAELALNELLGNYEKVSANVITRSPDSWQDLLIVDKGKADGITPNMSVLAKKGLIGRVIEVNQFSSKVELLTSKNQNSNHFPAKINSAEGEAYGLIKYFDDQTQTMIMTQLTGDTTIKAGDIVQTSGLGGNSPANLPIGTVESVKPDSFGLDREVYVKPYSDMYDISVVTIVKRLAGSEG